MRQSLAAVFLAACFAPTLAGQPSVAIENGTVLGVDLPQYGQHLFLGIPFAQPPVGDLRLRPPRSVNLSFGQLDATQYGPHCWSAFTTGFDDNSGFNNSEDCLTLNVIQPYEVSEKSPAPVLVWIHGGGLVSGHFERLARYSLSFTTGRRLGGSADFRYNGTYLVEASVANGHPIVFVSINYRLASFGFLGGSELGNEGSLNLGLRDQRLALHWVQENIAKFGGNPDDDSRRKAGGLSINAHIVAYSGRDDHLFTQTIVESGSIPGNYSPPSTLAYQATFDALLANSSCSSEINDTAKAQLSYRAAVGLTGLLFDGDILDVPSPWAAYRAGNSVKVAFLMGSNTDEGCSSGLFGANTTDEAKAALSFFISDAAQIDKLLELYPDVPALGCPYNTGDFQMDPVQNGIFSTPGTQNKRVAAIAGDVLMAAGGRFLAQTLSNEVPFYKYRFNHKPYDVSFGVQDFVGHFVEV
ncbi:alpha/beta-hydrolase [Mycena amicta]|nr:alpha/beta-hydrolase [Mycena amicta]